jgi:hypothetical protein
MKTTPKEAFAAFGDEVPAEEVPMLVRNGHTVWSFGYGSDLDEDEFTTIEQSDLWAWDEDAIGVIASWAPFRVSAN